MWILKDNEEGSVSIEGAIAIPILLLVILTFSYILFFIAIIDTTCMINDNILINNQIDEYDKENKLLDEKYEQQLSRHNRLVSYIDNNKLEKKLEENIVKALNNIEKNKIDSIDIKVDYENDELTENIIFIFKYPLNIFNHNKLNKYTKDRYIRCLGKGDSIKDYTIVSSVISAKKDIWSLRNLDRAKEIVNILGGNINFDGTSIDKIENKKLISIVSLDFRKSSYQEEGKISNKLRIDADKLINFKEGIINGDEIDINRYNEKMLHVVIPDDTINKNVEIELMRIRTYCDNNGIQFKVTALKGG